MSPTNEKVKEIGAIAFSYKRFSDPSQASGDSIRRQTDLAEAWSKRTGILLDNDKTIVIVDEGLSGYHARNLDDTAALGQFLRLIEAKAA